MTTEIALVLEASSLTPFHGSKVVYQPPYYPLPGEPLCSFLSYFFISSITFRNNLCSFCLVLISFYLSPFSNWRILTLEHIFPGVSSERAIAEVSSFPIRRRNHRRGLSTQSFSSGSDHEEFSSKPVHSLRQSESLLRPRRQPRNPPDGSLLQNNAGFAHFLKQHASPPHKRVTAGGRIVPAGPNSPPPTFKMETIDAMLQSNPRGTWPSRYLAPPPKLQNMFASPYQSNHMNGGNRPNVRGHSDKNGIHGNPVNYVHQRSQTFPVNGAG